MNRPSLAYNLCGSWGIRTPGTRNCARQFSKLLVSATHPNFQSFGSLTSQHSFRNADAKVGIFIVTTKRFAIFFFKNFHFAGFASSHHISSLVFQDIVLLLPIFRNRGFRNGGFGNKVSRILLNIKPFRDFFSSWHSIVAAAVSETTVSETVYTKSSPSSKTPMDLPYSSPQVPFATLAPPAVIQSLPPSGTLAK
jgi:hypothetical protein